MSLSTTTQRIRVARYADIPANFRPGGSNQHTLQELLAKIDPANIGDDLLISTITDLNGRWIPDVVDDRGRAKEWHIHKGHKAKNVQPSPFVRGIAPRRTSTLTLVFNKNFLVRVIPGEYVPPLPWQTSAKDEPSGKQTCIDFWMNHSYHYRDQRIKQMNDLQMPPQWYLDRL